MIRLGRDLGRTVGELKRTISNKELIEQLAYYDIEARLQDVRRRHPEWPPEKVQEYQETAWRLHQQAQRMKRGQRGDRN